MSQIRTQSPQLLSPDQPERVTTDLKIAMLIPAHNEEASIRDTVVSSLKQTVRTLPDVHLDIFVIADNCIDRTEQVVLDIMGQIRDGIELPPVFLLNTLDNENRKAGALNHAYRFIRERGYTYIVSLDADTLWDSNFLKNGITAMERAGEELGGMCGRVGLLPYQKEPFPTATFREDMPFWIAFLYLAMQISLKTVAWTWRRFWAYLWWSFQNVEYSIGQSVTVERCGKAQCLIGPGTIYRARVLEEVYQKDGQVWPSGLTEDFDLTVKIQMLGYETRVGHDMFAYTDCPIGFLSHGIQRERWNGGNLSTYMKIGMHKQTFWGGMDMGWQLICFVCRLCLIVTAIQIWVTQFAYIDTFVYISLFGPLLLTAVLNMLRFRYVAYKSPFQFFLCVCFGYELYALWYGIVLTKSYLKAFTNKVNRWR